MYTTHPKRPKVRLAMWIACWLTAWLPAHAAVPGAQPTIPCGSNEKLSICHARVLSSDAPSDNAERHQATPQARVTDATMDAADNALKAIDLSSFGSSVSTGALRPFLDRLLAGINGLSTSEMDGELTIAYAPNQQFSIDGVLHDAEVADKLLEQYAEADRTAAQERLKRDLGDLADVSLKLTYNHCSSTSGRRVRDHAELLRGLVDGLIDPQVNELLAGAREKRRLALNRVAEIFNRTLPDGTHVSDATWPMVESSGDPALIEEVRSLLLDSDVGQAMLDAHQEFVRSVNESDLRHFYQLVANQPQRYIEVSHRARDPEVGADTTTVKGVWEIPRGSNINGLRKACAKTSDAPNPAGPGLAVNLACYKRYIAREETQLTLATKPRFKIEVTATDVAGNRFVDTGHAVAFETQSDFKATLNLGYSRVLSYVDRPAVADNEPEKAEGSRLDIELAGEYVDKEELLQRRLRATVSLTQRINDDIDAVLALVWASEPEFLGEVDEKLGARAGLRFKIGRTGEASGG
ncbi:MAG: hypothetical protein AAGM22_15250 [Acidobacteriota bacterium]